MRPFLRAALTRASSRSPAPSALTHTPFQIRRYSSPQQQPPSATGNFYKTFTRPVAKCALLAVLVYQLVYFGWTRLEVNEIKEERQAEIVRLEAQVKSLQAVRAKEAAAAAEEKNTSGDGAEETRGASRSWWRWK